MKRLGRKIKDRPFNPRVGFPVPNPALRNGYTGTAGSVLLNRYPYCYPYREFSIAIGKVRPGRPEESPWRLSLAPLALGEPEITLRPQNYAALGVPPASLSNRAAVQLLSEALAKSVTYVSILLFCRAGPKRMSMSCPRPNDPDTKFAGPSSCP